MLSFPQEYFEDEVRNGFYISSIVKRVWAAQLEMLNDLDKLCNDLGIRYIVDWGTLLGAVRHHGYIPWDDDMDIGMPREDYERFKTVTDKMGWHYHLLDHHTEPDHIEVFSRLVNHTGICMESAHLEKYHGCPFVVGIDIFPYDYVYSDESKESYRLKKADELARRYTAAKNEHKRGLNDLIRRFDELACECPKEESGGITFYFNFVRRKGAYVHKEDFFNDLERMNFENIQVNVPKAYDDVLRAKYGDYTVVKRAKGMHDYPYITDQLNILRAHRPSFCPIYKYTPSDLWNPAEGGNSADEAQNDSARRTIVFLPYKASCWESMRPVWEKAMSDPENDVYVTPLPYYHKTWDGQPADMCYEKDMFPSEINPLPLDAYPIFTQKADIIYFQEPSDDHNPGLSVPPIYYSDRLRACCRKLILIPALSPDAPGESDVLGMQTMDNYVTMPGVLRSDIVYVDSEEMCEAYVRKLTEFAGTGNKKDLAIIDDKIMIRPDL